MVCAIRKILELYTKLLGIADIVAPHKLQHFLFTWLKKQNIDNALIQPYFEHENRQFLEIRLSIVEAQQEYNKRISKFLM